MVLTLSIMAIIVAFSLYDYFSSRSWQMVTSRERNETVFEHRNKEYGAYQIRRDYDKRVILVFLSVTVGIGALWGASALFRPLQQKSNGPISTDNIATLFNDSKEEIIEIPEPEVKQPEVQSLAKITEFREFVASDVPDTKPLDIVNPETPIGVEGQEGDGKSIWDEPVIAPRGTGGTGPISIIEPPISDPVDVVDEPAKYPGGMEALRKFIAENIDMNSIDGSAKVSLKFVVDIDGSISSVVVTKMTEDCESCKKAAIKVVKSMEKWTPGKVNGKPVRSYYRLPITIQ